MQYFENGKYQIQLKESVKNYERMIAGEKILLAKRIY
jgi:hypothetical protein